MRLAGCVALFSVSLVSLFLFDTRREGGREGAGAATCGFARSRLSFYFGFLSLVVRTAELDGGCMRLSRDHM